MPSFKRLLAPATKRLRDSQAMNGAIRLTEGWTPVILSLITGGALATWASLLLRYRYDQFAELERSKLAYSSVKTGVDYLDTRLSSLNFKEGIALIQEIHTQKHIAELHPTLKRHLRKRRWKGAADEWANLIFYRLAAAREILEEHVETWDTKSPSERLAILKRRASCATEAIPRNGSQNSRLDSAFFVTLSNSFDLCSPTS